MSFRAAMRAAAVTLLVYPARPRTVNPPTAFVDGFTERVDYTGLYQRHPTAEVIVVHGLFDSKEAADQADAFVDGFLVWVVARIHAAGGNTSVGIVGIEDIPDYVNAWVRPEEQRTYYATRISLEGLALTA